MGRKKKELNTLEPFEMDVFFLFRRRRRPVSNVNHNNLHNILLRSCNVCLAFV